MLKRIFDILFSFCALAIMSPVLAVVIICIWLQDYHSPFYIAARAARGGGTFSMVKLRSMVINADRSGVNSTSASDRRITPIGHFVRRFKLDEFTQLWNVLIGDMSVVGPRPQAERDASMYTEAERRMLTARPGITDPASIVFSDEGEILKGSATPDLLYQQIIRPWKSRLALAYLDHCNVLTDISLILITVIAILSRPAALRLVGAMLRMWNVDPMVLRMASRQEQLMAYPPPGAEAVVSQY